MGCCYNNWGFPAPRPCRTASQLGVIFRKTYLSEFYKCSLMSYVCENICYNPRLIYTLYTSHNADLVIRESRRRSVSQCLLTFVCFRLMRYSWHLTIDLSSDTSCPSPVLMRGDNWSQCSIRGRTAEMLSFFIYQKLVYNCFTTLSVRPMQKLGEWYQIFVKFL